MLVIRTLPAGMQPPREIDARVLCGEDVSVCINRSGIRPFSLSYNPAVAARWRTFPPTAEAEAALSGLLPGAVAFGAFQDEDYVGQAVAIPGGTGWCHLADLRVDPAYRMAGIGRALLDACQRFAVQRNMTGLRAVVSDANPVMCQFCEHCGFRVEGIDRLAYAMLPEERIKPMLQRACALVFYRQNEGR